VSTSRYEEHVVDSLPTARNLEELRDTRSATGMSDAAFIDVCDVLLAAETRAWRIGWSAPPEVSQPNEVGEAAGT
jgi:hypothetical protein